MLWIKVAVILDFWISQGSVATQLRWGIPRNGYREFPWSLIVKEYWKAVYSCQSYWQKIEGVVFLKHGVQYVW